MEKVEMKRLYNNAHKFLKSISDKNPNYFNGTIYESVNGVESHKEGSFFISCQTLAYIGISNTKFDIEKVEYTLKNYKANKQKMDYLINKTFDKLGELYKGQTIEMEDKSGNKYDRSIEDVIKVAKSNLKEMGVDIGKSKQDNMEL